MKTAHKSSINAPIFTQDCKLILGGKRTEEQENDESCMTEEETHALPVSCAPPYQTPPPLIDISDDSPVQCKHCL